MSRTCSRVPLPIESGSRQPIPGTHLPSIATFKNVRVNAIGPGVVATGMTRPAEPRTGAQPPEFGNWLSPMGRRVEPVDVANAVLFLASDEAGYVTGHLPSSRTGL